MNPNSTKPDPALDLCFEREVDLPPELIWRAWTEPELLMQWFCPRPWKVTEAEIELYPGGLFRTVMQSPEGDAFPNTGCFLEIVPPRRIAWTSALGPGFRPMPASVGGSGLSFHVTAIVSFEPSAAGTTYSALVRHGSVEDCQKHKDMGFQEGWGAAFDQLVELVKTL